MIKKTYKIHGMHCAGCVRTIERVLEKTAGVHSASVNFASESALIEFDENIVSESEIVRAVQSVGYKINHNRNDERVPRPVSNGVDIGIQTKKDEAIDDRNLETISIKVLGMDSSHCAMTVQNVLKKLPGVKNIDVDFSNQRAKIVFNAEELTVSDIFKMISDAGYKPIKEEGGVEEILDKEKIEHEKQVKILKTKLVIGGFLSVLIFLGSFPEWFSFTPQILNNNWILLILTAPIQFWVGFQFYSCL